MKSKILLGLGALVFAGASYAAATGAFFTATANAQANVFTAGSLDLAIAKDNNGTPVNGWLPSQTAPWDFLTMAPGATPSVASVWLKNTGSIDGSHIGVSATNGNDGGTGFEKQIRITSLTLGGSNLLQGGAGATIGAYVAPTNCTVTLSGSDRLTTVIAAATSGAVICATGSNYNSSWEPAPTIPVSVSNVTIESVGGPSVTATEPFNVTGSNVTIRGFSISDPNSSYGVQIASGVSNITVEDNNLHDIGTTLSSGSVQAISLTDGASGASHFIFSGNTISNIGNLNLVEGSSGSAKGIYIGNSVDAGVISDVTIENNIISHVQASTAAWTAGRGAYGVLVNVGSNGAGNTSGLVIKNNTISDLEGLWSHAIGLEGNTPSANVTYNDISNLVDHKGNTDAAGIRFESNASAGTVYANDNNFALSMSYGISNATIIPVNGTNNWWGDFTPANHVLGPVNTANPAGGPFSGFVNGIDQNGNGYADLQDLRLTPLVNVPVSLAAGAEKQLIMGVQVDGPTTGNVFQGANLTTDLTFTLSQQ